MVVKKGEVLIFRRRDGSIKSKIDLLLAGVKLTFHNDNSHITIAHASSGASSKDCILDCHTTSARDSWLSALFTARGRLEVDTESDVILSGDDSDEDPHEEDNTIHTSTTTTTTKQQQHSSNSEPGGDDDTENEDEDEYSDALLAFQDVRSSMIAAHLTMSTAKEDLFVAPDASLQRKHHHIHATRAEELARLRCIKSILVFIESVPHGGRVILLHLGVLASAGIKVEDILLALGEKQKNENIARRASLTSTTISMHKLYAATFVRDMIFHPIYSKRPEVKSDAVNGIIDRFFSHCRLRRFSHDDEHMMMMSVHPIGGDNGSGAGLDLAAIKALMLDGATGGTTNSTISAIRKAQPAVTAMMNRAEMMLKKKRHSFPNILTPLRAKAGLLDTAKLEELLKKGGGNGGATCNSIPKPNTCSGSTTAADLAKTSSCPSTGKDDSDDDDLVMLENRKTSTSSMDSELFRDESIPEPLQSLLWRNSCQEVAEQITLFHHSQLARLCLWDFLHNPREAAKEISESFNRLVCYLVWSVLVEDTPKDRAEVIESIISLALAACGMSLNNFHLVMACVGCLGDTPLMVSRLPLTWKKVRPKFKTHLRELRTLCDHSGGFENLRKRQALLSAKCCCVPFIGVIGVALERLRATNYFTDNDQRKQPLLDFEKLERQYVTLAVLENGIQRPYKAVTPIEQVHTFLATLVMEFATPRLLQLRSQQILGLESSTGSGSASSRHTSFLQPPLSSGSASSTGSAVATGPSFGETGDTNSSGSGSLPFLSFRSICSTLVSVPYSAERLEIGLEALLADDKQPLTRQLRRFWLDFKSSVWLSACHFCVQGVRTCVDGLVRDVLMTKATELQQLSGLDENCPELHQVVYSTLVRLVTQPIFTLLFAKIKYTFASEDAKMAAYVSSEDQHGHEQELQRQQHSYASSPMELVAWIARHTESPDRLSADSESKARLLKQLYRSDAHLGAHLFSVLYTLQQLLDVALLPHTEREVMERLAQVVAHVQAAAQ